MPYTMRRFQFEIRNSKFEILCATLALFAIAAAGCATPLGDMVLARVNDEIITVQDAQDAFESGHKGHGVLLAGQNAVRNLVEKVVDKRLLLQEAHYIGLDKHPDLESAVQDFVASRGREELFKDEVTGKVKITEEEIQAVHDKMRIRFRSRHILVATRAEAEEALLRLRAGVSFGEVASQVSIAPSGRKGGDLGLVAWGRLDPILEARLEQMGQGELSEAIETETGWNILLLEERREADPPERSKVRAGIAGTLKQRADQARAQTYARELAARWAAVRHEHLITEENFLRGPYDAGREKADRAVPVAEFAGGEKISLAELRNQLNLEALGRMAPAVALGVLRRQLEQAVNERLLTKEAARLGYAERPATAQAVRRIREDFAVNRLLAEVIFAKISATEEDARAYYEGHPEAFTDPEQVKVSLIRLESEEQAREVLAALQTGQEFAALARARSKDVATAQFGGEVGWVSRGQWDPDLEGAAFSLSVGQTAVAKGGGGHYVLRVDGRKEAALQPLAQAKAKAMQAALRQQRRAELKRWVDKLRQASTIVIDQEAIARAVAAFEEQVKQKMEALTEAGKGMQSKESQGKQDGL